MCVGWAAWARYWGTLWISPGGHPGGSETGQRSHLRLLLIQGELSSEEANFAGSKKKKSWMFGVSIVPSYIKTKITHEDKKLGWAMEWIGNYLFSDLNFHKLLEPYQTLQDTNSL
jgi:hypothetical protein